MRSYQYGLHTCSDELEEATPRSHLACLACWRPTRVGSAFRKLRRVQPNYPAGGEGGIWLQLPS